MSKRRRGVRDTRPPQDERRPFAVSGGDADSSAAPLGGGVRELFARQGAGQMLRAMREAAGIDAALVASALKVAPQKIDALEDERYDELPDVTFARGLAAAFCRAFGADPAPVLARMPMPESGLHATGNANQPMQGGSGLGPGTPMAAALPKPLLWIVAALLLLALLIWLLPAQPDNPSTSTVESAPLPAPAIVEPEHTVLPAPAQPASEAASAAEVAASPAAAAASARASAASAASATAAAGGELFGIEAREEVWVEVVDATERKRISRTLAKGERASVTDAPLPLSVAIGRRDAASVTVRGKPYDLTKVGSGPVTRFQVK